MDFDQVAVNGVNSNSILNKWLATGNRDFSFVEKLFIMIVIMNEE